MKKLFTSESVTLGHPDKIADQISDGILDAYMEKDPYARVACETMVTTNRVFILGEITSTAEIDVDGVCRNIVEGIGYDEGFDPHTLQITCCFDEQSPDIALGVDSSCDEKLLGAGDQGLMFGYAVDESESLMPLELDLARKLTDRLQEVREKKILPYLKADGKSQVTIETLADGKRIDCIVLSAQHSSDIDMKTLRRDLENTVIRAIPEVVKYMDDDTELLINPTGKFVKGGPSADTGLTGRKIIVDTYGGRAHHGGGAFSGKDPTKVDRSASYALRNIAKTIVRSGVAKECELQASYAIGKSKPVSLSINTFGTSELPDELLLDFVERNFDLTPQGIIDRYDLRRPIYRKTASNGHFGNEEFPWEKCDPKLLDELKSLRKQ